jgi:hypothetical protein
MPSKFVIKNIPPNVKAGDVHAFCTTMGVKTEKVFIPRSHDGANKSYAVVSVADDSASSAVALTHGKTFAAKAEGDGGSRVVLASLFIQSPVKIFVGNIPWEMEEADLIKALQLPAEECIHVRLSKDKATGRSRGFAVLVVAKERADRLKKGPVVVSGRTLRIVDFQKKGGDSE